MAVTNTASRHAVTHYEVLERFGDFTHLKLRLETGRTHQIRVHMAYLGHPVAGDDVYGPKKVITALNGQCLHAKKIGFIHPKTKEYLEFDSSLPEYFEKFIKKLQQKF
jgi:23S rRNA pseudouridine1911/1915/1917 synthase